jgi:hypothetical protein
MLLSAIFVVTFCFKKRNFSLGIGMLFFVIPFSLFVGFRGDVGPDYYSYIDIFNRIFSIDNLLREGLFNPVFHAEPIFNLLVAILLEVSQSSVFIFTIIALLSIGLNYTAMRKISVEYLFLVFAFYLSHDYLLKDFIQIRAGLASAIVLYSVTFLQCGRRETFYVGCFLAAGIHYSAALAFFLPAILARVGNKKTIVTALVAAFLISYFGLARYLIETILQNYFWKLEIYMSDERVSYNLGFFHGMSIFRVLLIAYIYSNLTWFLANVRYFEVLFSMLIMATLLIILFSEIAILGSRLSSIFNVAQWVLLVAAFHNIGQRLKAPQIALVFAALLPSLFAYYHVFINFLFQEYVIFE